MMAAHVLDGATARRALLHEAGMDHAAHGSAPMRHGTLEGHVLPGVLFIVWGAWWVFHYLERRRPASAHGAAVSCAWYTAPSFLPPSLLLIEPYLKALLPFLGFADELLPYSPLFTDGVMNHGPIHSFQHCVMYASVLWSGLVDLACLRHDAHLPRGLDGLVLAAGFAAQGFVLVFHLTGPALDVRLHALLVLASFGVAAAIGVALLTPHSEMAAFARCVALLTLGSFWIQTGDLMFCRPAFDTNEGVAIAPTIFLTHIFSWSVALVGCLLLTPLRYIATRSEPEAGEDEECSGKPLAVLPAKRSAREKLED